MKLKIKNKLLKDINNGLFILDFYVLNFKRI